MFEDESLLKKRHLSRFGMCSRFSKYVTQDPSIQVLLNVKSRGTVLSLYNWVSLSVTSFVFYSFLYLIICSHLMCSLCFISIAFILFYSGKHPVHRLAVERRYTKQI